MKKYEAVNCSLAGLLFAFNLRYSSFLQNDLISNAFQASQLLDGTIRKKSDFIVLTNNNLLSTLQTHSFMLNEAVKLFSKNSNRQDLKHDHLFGFIRSLVSELRNATSHFGMNFRFRWERTFEFRCFVPVEKVSAGHYRFNHKSKLRREIRFRGTKGRELRITPGFFYRLIILSFHVIKILSYRKKDTCEQYLKGFRGSFKYL
jgi:hypothetical protein